MGTENLQGAIAASNVGFFLREFSFSRTTFTPRGGTEVELADHVVSVGDVLLLFQMKQRTEATDDPASENTWFEKKVRKQAIRQLRDTLDYLAGGRIELKNDKGHVVELPRELAGLTVVKVVVYAPGDALPLQPKHHPSSKGGFIHLIRAADYDTILRTLVTLPEVIEFLRHRERLCVQFPAATEAVAEEALLGHFLNGNASDPPASSDAAHARALRKDTDSFDISTILHKFEEKSYASFASRAGRTTLLPTDYYAILIELLRLPRTDLAAFKQRFMWAWDACGGAPTQPSRLGSVATGCAFVFIPVPDMSEHAANALNNLTLAAKYDLKADRCVGIAFRRDGEYRLMDWMFYEQPWEYDADLERLLKESYPFRSARLVTVPRYRFGE
jgi:hypothetical protein